MSDEPLPTAAAAADLGVDVSRFHRLAARHDITPALEAPGLRGAKFWRRDDIDRLRDLLAAESRRVTAWLLVIVAGLMLGVLIEIVQRRGDDRAERERARASHRRLMREIGRHP